MLKLFIVFIIILSAESALAAEKNACVSLAEQSLLVDYSNAIKDNQLQPLGIKLITTTQRKSSTPSIHRIVRGSRNSSKIYSASQLFKKGVINWGIPLERAELLGYRIQLEYQTVKGMQVKGQVVENLAILTKIDLITPEGFSTNIASLPAGGPAIQDTLFTLKITDGQLKPTSVQKILNQEIKRLQKIMASKPELETSIKPAIEDLKGAINAKDILTLKEVVDALAKTHYNLANSPVPRENVTIDIDPVISGKDLGKFTDFSYDFFFNPSKNLDGGRTQDLLKEFKSEKEFEAYWKKIKSENFRLWIVDRSKRQIGNAPGATMIGLIAGVISSYLAYSFGTSDDEKLKKATEKNSVSSDGTIINNNGEPYLIEGTHNSTKVDFQIREEKAGEYSLAPVQKKKSFKKTDLLTINGAEGSILKVKISDDIINRSKIPIN